MMDMNISQEGWLGISMLLGGGLLMTALIFLIRNGIKFPTRHISGYEALSKQVGQAVESGGRVHVALGSGSIINEDTGVTLAGMAILDVVADASSISDLPPVATTGDPTTLPLMSDTIRRAYLRAGLAEKFETPSARLVAFDPYAMAAGTTAIIYDDDVRANVVAGSLGPELALIAETGQRKGIPQVAGSSQLQGQAVAYAMADHVLVGEELFVGRAYLTQQPSEVAGLVVQDIFRWVTILGIIIGSVLGIFGLIK